MAAALEAMHLCFRQCRLESVKSSLQNAVSYLESQHRELQAVPGMGVASPRNGRPREQRDSCISQELCP